LTAEVPASRHPSQSEGGPVRSDVVLLADQEDHLRAPVAFHLALAGYPVVEATTLEGLRFQSRANKPDVVILSDVFDHCEVAQLLAIVRAIPELLDVPVITVSSDPSSRRLVECLHHGARDHVRRQDGADELIARVHAVLRTDQHLERLRRRNAELEFLGNVDGLTGMATRRYLEEELDRLAAGAARHAVPLSAVMARVDEPTGPSPVEWRQRREVVLRELTYLLASVRRTDDFAGVWDDLTVVVLLPMTPLVGARIFAERYRAVVGAAPIRSETSLIAITLSCACAEVGDDTSGLLRELERGVMALQEAGGDAVTP